MAARGRSEAKSVDGSAVCDGRRGRLRVGRDGRAARRRHSAPHGDVARAVEGHRGRPLGTGRGLRVGGVDGLGRPGRRSVEARRGAGGGGRAREARQGGGRGAEAKACAPGACLAGTIHESREKAGRMFGWRAGGARRSEGGADVGLFCSPRPKENSSRRPHSECKGAVARSPERRSRPQRCDRHGEGWGERGDGAGARTTPPARLRVLARGRE